MRTYQSLQVEGSYSHLLKIPNSWVFSQLNEVIEVIGGSQPPKTEFRSESADGLIRLIQIRDYKSDLHKVYIPIDKAKRLVLADEVMIGRYGPPIFQILRGIEGAYNVALMKAKPIHNSMTSDYLFYYLTNRNIYNYVEAASDRTAGQSGVNKAHLEKYPVGLPPLAEQKEIVAQLDKLLAQVESTKARLDAIPAILKRFRQSVLAAAVSGKLTEEWREGKAECQWDVVILDDIIESIGQGWSPKCHSEPVTGKQWGVIKTSSVQKIEFIQKENKRLPEKLEVRESLKIVAGDILTTRAGPRVRCGVTCYVEKVTSNLMICDKVYRYQVSEGKGVSKFLAMQLNSIPILEKVEELKTGISESGMNLTQKKFKLLELNWPQLKEQTEIVRRVEELFAYADKVEAQVNAAQQRVNNLTQSILVKAFSGELTAQWRKKNPDLITGENSAAALLEKIKGERAKLANIKKKKPKKLTKPIKPKVKVSTNEN